MILAGAFGAAGEDIVGSLKKIITKDTELLNEAEKERLRFSEAGMWNAIRKYIEVIDGRSEGSLIIDAHVGLSRTFSDLACLRYMRGMSLSDYPTKAINEAYKAIALSSTRNRSKLKEAEVALAYAYYAEEMGQSTRRSTQNKVRELRSKKFDDYDIDLHYLAYISGDEESKEFNDAVDYFIQSDLLTFGKNTHLFRILIEVVELHVIASGLETTRADMKEPLKRRALELINIAKSLWPGKRNAMLEYARGHLFLASEDFRSAEEAYREALELQNDFPRARADLGTTFALRQDYRTAAEHYQTTLS